MKEEEWRPVGDGLHELSNFGRFRTVEKWVGRAPMRYVPPRLVKGDQLAKLNLDSVKLMPKVWPELRLQLKPNRRGARNR